MFIPQHLIFILSKQERSREGEIDFFFVLSALCAHMPRAKHSILIRWVQRLQQRRESDSHWTCLIAPSKAVQRLSGESKTDPYISNFGELSQPEQDRKGLEAAE